MKTNQQKCDECGGKIIVKKVDSILNGINLGKFPAEICTRCGEEVYDEKTFKKIEIVAKQKGVLGYAKKIALIQNNN